jgi:S1-C subfamily serine protease
VPKSEREQLQRWWDAYYHQQQMFYTDQPVPALVVDAGAGLLLTARSNLHGDAERGVVLLADGASVPCTVVATHLPLDLALLRADKPLAMPAAALSSSPQLANGQAIAVVGRHRREGGFTLTTGVVSATARRRAQNEFAFAQTDALANYGSLGGAVVDAAGAVVGMVVLLGPDGRSLPWAINSGVALFVDSATLLRVLPGLAAGDSVKRAPIIGMGVTLAHRPGIKPLVTEVAAGTGAEAAGIKRGDVLLEVDGCDAVNQQAISRALLRHRQGDRIAVKVQRGMETLEVQVEIRSFADEEK